MTISPPATAPAIGRLQAPFPWFGGKSRVAPIVWDRFGNVPNYVEPFAGSLAVLLGRPHAPKVETVNDLDGFICNFWRAIAHDPAKVAHYADWPVNENDLHARHAWLLQQRPMLTTWLEGDPDFYHAKIAGWWVWGLCCWIGSGWCSGSGPWQLRDGQLVHLGTGGQGVHRKLVHLGGGRGVHRKLVHLGDAGRGVHRGGGDALLAWCVALADRLQDVRVCCGDWTRVCGPSVTEKHGMTAIFLDPPYGDEADRQDDVYRLDSGALARDVRRWALEQGDHPLLRVALCGYAGEHDEMTAAGWTCVGWKAQGGYGSQGEDRGRDNCTRERIWFSPACLDPQPSLFDR